MNCRRAFTLIELLVVLAIIAIPIGMLFPGIQMVRESARRSVCLNNLRELSLACLNFQTRRANFPYGQDPNTGMSFLGQVLPDIERSDVWDSIWEEAASSVAYIDMTAFRTPIAIFSCPTDGLAEQAHLGNQGTMTAYTNYLGVSGRNSQLGDGVIHYGRVLPRDISDGLSNTLLLGERPIERRFRHGGYLVGGSVANFLGLAEVNPYHPVNNLPPGPYVFKKGNVEAEQSKFHFWSIHPQGANFAFADGSVRFFNYSAAETLLALSTRSGGEFISLE